MYDDAYVTMLYGDSYLLGVRVLGHSIRATGSTKKLVCIVVHASQKSQRILEDAGWILYNTEVIRKNTTTKSVPIPPRFWAVYTKLVAFKLPYRKVVFLDADTLVIRNIDQLFQCGGDRGFCANLKHSEHFNSGVLVLSPEVSLFDDLLEKLGDLESYDGADQGFLNEYFGQLVEAPLFHGAAMLDNNDSKSHTCYQSFCLQLERLPAQYNADVGLFLLNSEKWNFSPVSILHFTLGPVKPWDWWSTWLVKPATTWQILRLQLHVSEDDTKLTVYLFLMSLLPVLVTYVMLKNFLSLREGLRRQLTQNFSLFKKAVTIFLLDHHVEIGVFYGVTALLWAFAMPILCLIPRQAPPLHAWLLLFLWGFFNLSASATIWAQFCYSLGFFHSRGHWTGVVPSLAASTDGSAQSTLGLKWFCLSFGSFFLQLLLTAYIPQRMPSIFGKLLLCALLILVSVVEAGLLFGVLGKVFLQKGWLENRVP
mmetsp:Transcript_798/g.4990  ORF Transcript_798/g.4990 Transcript_798/m.4990 type:complete len:480 (-) Transcript_798:529-1968(-)